MDERVDLGSAQVRIWSRLCSGAKFKAFSKEPSCKWQQVMGKVNRSHVLVGSALWPFHHEQKPAAWWARRFPARWGA